MWKSVLLSMSKNAKKRPKNLQDLIIFPERTRRP
jgi:hypothetical protein